jgi:hypothetical protein
VAVIGAVVALVLLLNAQGHLPTPIVPAAPAFHGTPLPLPLNGWVWPYFSGTAAPNLTVKTQAGDGHHLVKLEDWPSGRPVALLFVRAGETGRVNVPPGTYRIKFARGDTWYGDQLRFGPDEACFVADKQFDFYHIVRSDGEEWAERTITLYPVLDGNLHKSRIPRDQF